MPALDELLQQKITLLEGKKQRRILTSSRCHDGVMVTREADTFISFSGNDYYGLSQHPQVIAAAIKATEQYGTGAGASRLVSGNHPIYAELEAKLAQAKGTQAALVFGSGYLANIGAITALMGKNDLILVDRLAHACILDGARLSGATVYRFAHNSMEHARMLLESHRREHQHCVVITETVFSMDGDRPPFLELAELAAEYDAWLMTDSAHDFFAPVRESQIKMGTLSKALGSYGGYVCGSKTLIDYLQTTARSLIFSTALPPATIAAAIAALDIVQADKTLQRKPLNNAQYFTQLCGLPLAQSAIVPVIVGESDKALQASAMLASEGFYVAAIRSPTVPENTARLRFAFSALHSKEQIEKVATLLLQKGIVCTA